MVEEQKRRLVLDRKNKQTNLIKRLSKQIRNEKKERANKIRILRDEKVRLATKKEKEEEAKRKLLVEDGGGNESMQRLQTLSETNHSSDTETNTTNPKTGMMEGSASSVHTRNESKPQTDQRSTEFLVNGNEENTGRTLEELYRYDDPSRQPLGQRQQQQDREEPIYPTTNTTILKRYIEI